MRSRTMLVLASMLAACGDVGAASYAAPPLDANADAGADAIANADTDATANANANADAGADANAGPAMVAPGGGVDFRLWAPHATAAHVTGDFPEASVAMTAAGGGVFTAHVAGAHAGSSYSFLLDTPQGQVARVDPYCRALVGSACTVVDPSAYAWKSASFTRAAREAQVVYELHVGSFGATPGFAGARARLDELVDLGVNVIELMPVTDFGGNPNGWGYNPELWLAPKPTYGAPDDLRALVDDAHARGIAVWLDVVMNHYTGYTKAPLYCFDGYCPSGSAGDIFFPAGSPYQKTPWGPRPNYQEPEVQSLLLASVKTWLDEYRGDGFRWDSVSNIRALDGTGTTPGGKDLLVAANALTHAKGASSVAEDLKGYAAVTQAPSAGGFGFDAQWDGFGYAITAQLANPSDDARDLGAVQSALTSTYAGDPFARLLFLEDHDTVGNGGARLPVKIDSAAPESFDARRRDMLGAVMLLTAPGVPMLFQGEEFLATQGFVDPPPPLAAPTVHGAQIRAFYKDMIALRRSVPGLATAGIDVFHRNDPAKVIAYQRGEAIVVVNLKNKAYTEYDVGVPTAGPWKIRMNTESTTYGDDFIAGQTGSVMAKAGAKDGRPYTLPLVLGAYAAMVITP
jgi:1,4-alpha-glucan branching enzyme